MITSKDEVATPEYRQVLQARYTQPGWGGSGKHHAVPVAIWAQGMAERLHATGLIPSRRLTILDYGCGRGTFKKRLLEHTKYEAHEVTEYDPGIIGKDELPQPADIVVCTDVLEHVEAALLPNVLNHLKSLARHGLFLIIASGPAREVLPNGQNAHLIQKSPHWWLRKLEEFDLKPTRTKIEKGLHVWVER